MSVRRLVISEEFGVYKIEGEGIAVSGGTLEGAMFKAVQLKGIAGVEIRSAFDAAEVLDSLLGPQRGAHDGPVHA